MYALAKTEIAEIAEIAEITETHSEYILAIYKKRNLHDP